MDVVALGVVTGLTYALLAVGLVLIYQSSRVINFAHGALGTFAALLMPKLVLDRGWSYAPALLVCLAVAVAIGALVERVLMVRFFERSRIVALVATIGVAQLLRGVAAMIPPTAGLRFRGYPSPLDMQFEIGALVLTGGHIAILVVTPLVAIALAAFLRFTRFGLAIRAAASNQASARLAGISAHRVSTFAWATAAALSALTAIMLGPVRGFSLDAMGPGLMLRALTAAMIARMTSIPLALGAGIAIGVLDQVVFFHFPTGGLVELVIFLVLVVALATRGGALTRTTPGEESSWDFTPVHRARRSTSAMSWAVVIVVAGAAPVFLSPSHSYLLGAVALYAVMALSISTLTGLTGMVSLGQWAIGGVGAFILGVAVNDFFLPWILGVALAATAGAVISLAIGLPAFRLRGLFLAVTTLGFAVVIPTWLFQQTSLAASSSTATLYRPLLGPIDLTGERAYAYLCLGLLAVAAFVFQGLRGSALGRSMIAIRENERAAMAFAVPVARVKAVAFALSGAMAGAAGAMWANGLGRATADLFTPERSLMALAMAVIGGLGSVTGAILGAGFAMGIPFFLGGRYPWLEFLSTGLGLLVLLIAVPGGLADLVRRFVTDPVRAWTSRPIPEEVS